jgi:23S rRNA (adenine2503-C2)-methyltransferase
MLPREARKVVSAVDRGWHPSDPLAQLRRPIHDALRAGAHVPTLRCLRREDSAVDPFVKFLFATHDGERIETVRIPLEHPGRVSVCVSSQVGCALACAFCATGRLGLRRNLETWEIVEQVRHVRDSLAGSPATALAGQAGPSRTGLAGTGQGQRPRVHGVVFQGMGEPLANLDRVLAAIEALRDPSGLAIDQRAMTVCTAGLPAGIRRLAREAPKVRLGISIASARPETRHSLMPITGAHPLAETLAAAADHARQTGLAPLWAVTLLAGVNDHDDDARALAALARAFAATTGKAPRITLIAYNPIVAGPAPDAMIDEHASPARDPFSRSDLARELAFRAVLFSEGIAAHRRYSGGGDVGAACGQLAARE